MLKSWVQHFDEVVLLTVGKSQNVFEVLLDDGLDYLELIAIPGFFVLERITILQNHLFVLLLKLDFEGGPPFDSVLLFLVLVLHVEIARIVDDFAPSLVSLDQLCFSFRIQLLSFHS